MPWVSRTWVEDHRHWKKWAQQRIESLERRQDESVAQDQLDALRHRIDNLDRHTQTLYAATSMGVPTSAMTETEYDFSEDGEPVDENDLTLDSMIDMGGDDAEPI